MKKSVCSFCGADWRGSPCDDDYNYDCCNLDIAHSIARRMTTGVVYPRVTASIDDRDALVANLVQLMDDGEFWSEFVEYVTNEGPMPSGEEEQPK